MLLNETIDKTRNFVFKTIGNLKCVLFEGYRKLPKSLSLNPFSCSRCNLKSHPTDQFYSDIFDEWEPNTNKASTGACNSMVTKKEPMKQEDENSSIVKFEKRSPGRSRQQWSINEKKNRGSVRKGDESCSKNVNKGSSELAQKMKDLDMIDGGDLEQVLDIEEAIHYYSRLKSPVYLDIVDKFFMDMYSELSVPKASISSVNNSKRRFGSIRL